MSNLDSQDKAHPSGSDSSASEGEAYAPRKSSTKTLRPIFNLVADEGPSIILTTPTSHGHPSLARQTALHQKKIAAPGKLNPGTWSSGNAQRRKEARARGRNEQRRSLSGIKKETRSRSVASARRRPSSARESALSGMDGEGSEARKVVYAGPDLELQQTEDTSCSEARKAVYSGPDYKLQQMEDTSFDARYDQADGVSQPRKQTEEGLGLNLLTRRSSDEEVGDKAKQEAHE